MMNPKIKIIVPTLNTYLIIPRLIDSLKKQTWKEWNLLLIDGESDEKHFENLRNFCLTDSRLNVVKQKKNYKGIYGAMNQGFKTIKNNELVLFWGSDDWAISPKSFEEIISQITTYKREYDLIVCTGRYIDLKSKKISRIANFFNNKFLVILNNKCFQKKLFLGCTPPHQATFFNKKAFDKLSSFSEKLNLASDLDYFLKFSKFDNISILVLDSLLVNMSTNGISSQKNSLRIKEVLASYIKAFGIFFLIPFTLRYLRRIFLKLV